MKAKASSHSIEKANRSNQENWCLACIVQIFMAEPSLCITELILNEHKVAYNALKAGLERPHAVQHYFQTGPPEIV